jgi:hypothetical protein
MRASIDFGAAVHPRALTCLLKLGASMFGSNSNLNGNLNGDALNSPESNANKTPEEIEEQKAQAEEFAGQMAPALVKLFSSNERSVRVSLLSV